jgi:hypothetical protein
VGQLFWDLLRWWPVPATTIALISEGRKYVRGWLEAGPVIHDAGYSVVSRWIGTTVITSQVFLLWQLSAGPLAWLGLAFVALMMLPMAFGRLQICENGVWHYCWLLRWPFIGDYRWSPQGKLILSVNRRWSRDMEIPVPAAAQPRIEAFLQELVVRVGEWSDVEMPESSGVPSESTIPVGAKRSEDC